MTKDRIRGFFLALAVLLAFALGAGVGRVEAGGQPPIYVVGHATGTTQIEPVGYAGASGYQDIAARNLLAGTGVASTGAVNGFAYTQGGAGAPVGVPSVLPTGSYPLYVDTTNFVPYEYSGGAWHSVGATVTLQTAYNGGPTITEAGGNPVAISSTTADNASVLTVTKTPAGAQSGTILDVSGGANFAGTAGNFTFGGSGGTGNGVIGTLNAAGNAAVYGIVSATGGGQALRGLIAANVTNSNALYLSIPGASGSGCSVITCIGGAQTLNTPILTATQTWNAGGVTFQGIFENVTNTASAAASTLLDLQVGGTSQFGFYVGGDAVLHNTASSLATNATKGFTFVGSSAGVPTGVPTSYTGANAITVDSTNSNLYFYSGAAWNKVGANPTITTLAPLTGTAATSGTSTDTAVGVSASASNAGGACTALGHASSASGIRDTSVGDTAVASGSNGFAGGANSTVSSNGGVGIGNNASVAGTTGGVGIGGGVSIAHDYSIGFGTSATSTAANQLIVGGNTVNSGFITSSYFGSGVTDSTPKNHTLNGTGSTTNGTAGASLAFAGGKANQASDSGGSVSLQTAITGTGTTLVDRVKPNAVAKALTNNTLTSLVTATLATDDVSGFKLSYSVRVSDSVGHHNQVESGIVQFSAGNNNGTVGTPVVSVCGVPARYLDSGTLTVTWDVTQSGATGSIRVNVNSSLTATQETITYTILNDSDASLAIQ